jgi:hypothetical protein
MFTDQRPVLTLPHQQISNGGVSQLGEHCRALSWLSLHGLTTVTDVGIGHLAPQQTGTTASNGFSAVALTDSLTDNRVSSISSSGGCPWLQHLDVTGMYMLSDGAVREFARAGLQVTENCNYLYIVKIHTIATYSEYCFAC